MSAAPQTANEVILIDPSVSDYKTLIAGLSPDIPVILLPEAGNGLSNLAEALAGYQSLSGVHLVSHGSSGQLQLGDQPVDAAALSSHSAQLQQLAQVFAPGADLMLYGCTVAAGEQGEAFISQLSEALGGVDIAASNDRTGPLSLGGDWDLEYHEGEIESVLPFAVQGMQDIDHCLGCGPDGYTTTSSINRCDSGGSSTSNTPPAFISGTSFAVSENTANTSSLHDVNANDGNGGGTDSGVTYSITAGNTDGDNDGNLPFAINSTSGQITLNDTGDLDYENGTRSYSLTVQANDGQSSNNTSTQTITVTVTNDGDGDSFDFESVSDNDTTFDSSSLTFSLSGNMVGVNIANLGSKPIDSNGYSDGYMDSGYGQSRAGNIGGIEAPAGYTFRAQMFDVWPSSDQGAHVMVAGQSITVIGKLNGNQVVSATLTTFAYGQNPVPSGGAWQRIDLTGTDFLTTDIDAIEFSIGDSVNYLAVDNFVYDNLTLANQSPTLTTINDVTGGSEDSQKEISFSDLQGLADDADSDGSVDAFVVKAVSAGTLRIGADAGSATAWAANTNDLINAANKAFWTPDTDANGSLNAFTVVAKDDGGAESASPVQVVVDVTASDDAPGLSGTPTDIRVVEDSASNLDLSDLTFTEADNETITVTLNISAGSFSTPADGATVGNGVAETGVSNTRITLQGSADDINAYLDTASNIQYTGVANAAGEDQATLTISAVDSNDTALAGGNRSINIDITDMPDITSAAYDFSTNQLTVSGNGFIANGGGSDVDVSKLTLTGQGGVSYTLSSSADVNVSDANTFTVTLGGADIHNVESLLNQDGTSATDTTVYQLAADDDYITAATEGDIAQESAITVSNYAIPAVTSASYDWSNGQLVLTGTNFVAAPDASNDIDVTKLTITGEGGNTYTLTSDSVDITSSTSATIELNSEDKLHVHGLLNKDGTTSGDATGYNLALAEDWMSGSPATVTVADSTNGITVSNVAMPTITSAAFDADTMQLHVTGTNLFKKAGAPNDIDVSLLTITGGNSETYTLDSSSDVELTSATSFTVTLTGVDSSNIYNVIDQLGSSSTFGTVYNLGAADGWLTAAEAAVDISDATGNGIDVTIPPQISSATYNATTGVLVVTGSNIQTNGGGADIDASKVTLTGEGGATYTLTDTADVERDSISQFTLTLSATDQAAIHQILNKNGTLSTGGTHFSLAAADDWNTEHTTGDSSDSALLTVSGVMAPTITNAGYDASTGVLTVTGTGLLTLSGMANDIDVSKLTLTGEGGTTHTLISSSVEITSGSSFSLTLNATDKAAVNQILNKDGASSTSGTAYNLAAAEDWAAGADASVAVVDATGNSVTVSNVPAPTITSATYTTQGTLVVTGTGFLKKDGAANDIDVSHLTLTGQGGATYTLTDSVDVEISSATSFTVALSSTDKAGVNALLNTAGTAANDSTIYNLAGDEDWAAGADAGVNVADTSGNGITVTLYTPPSSGGTTSNDTTTTDTVDGMEVSTSTDSAGNVTTTIPIVTEGRTEDPGTSTGDADIPLINGDTNNNGNVVTATLPVGVGMSASGPATAQTATDALTTLVQAIDARDNNAEASLIGGAQTFLTHLAATTTLDVRTIIPTTTSASLTSPIVITGTSASTGSTQSEAFVIDLRSLPSGSALQLDNIEFASIMGSATVTGGAGSNYVVGDDQSQFIVLGADDDELHGGGGDDTVGSKGGDDRLFGDDGNDTLFGGAGSDQMHGGADRDTVTYDGNFDQYTLIRDHGLTWITSADEPDARDLLINVEQVAFADQTLSIDSTLSQEQIATLYSQVLGRQAEVDGFQYWAHAVEGGLSLGQMALSFIRSAESTYATAPRVGIDSELIGDQIEVLYEALLGRSSDAAGKAYWEEVMQNGLTLDQVAEGFVHSFELGSQLMTQEEWNFIV